MFPPLLARFFLVRPRCPLLRAAVQRLFPKAIRKGGRVPTLVPLFLPGHKRFVISLKNWCCPLEKWGPYVKKNPYSHLTVALPFMSLWQPAIQLPYRPEYNNTHKLSLPVSRKLARSSIPSPDHKALVEVILNCGGTLVSLVWQDPRYRSPW